MGFERGFDMASLDHAMWFHPTFRTDEWFLYDQESPVATGGRGLARGRIYDRAGRASRIRGAGGPVPVPLASAPETTENG